MGSTGQSLPSFTLLVSPSFLCTQHWPQNLGRALCPGVGPGTEGSRAFLLVCLYGWEIKGGLWLARTQIRTRLFCSCAGIDPSFTNLLVLLHLPKPTQCLITGEKYINWYNWVIYVACSNRAFVTFAWCFCFEASISSLKCTLVLCLQSSMPWFKHWRYELWNLLQELLNIFHFLWWFSAAQNFINIMILCWNFHSWYVS